MNQEKIKISDFYITTDLALATAISLHYPIDSIDRQDPQRVQFLFKSEGSLLNFVESFFRGELRVSPLTYFNQLKIIKSRIYGGQYGKL